MDEQRAPERDAYIWMDYEVHGLLREIAEEFRCTAVAEPYETSKWAFNAATQRLIDYANERVKIKSSERECERVHVWDEVDGSGVASEVTLSDPAVIVQLAIGHKCFEDVWFDRSVCPAPCGAMHHRCTDCGRAQGHCAYEMYPPPVDAKVFGRTVRRSRKRRGMTRTQLAEAAFGYGHEKDIKRVERGEIACTPEECRALTKALGVTVTVDGKPLDTV